MSYMKNATGVIAILFLVVLLRNSRFLDTLLNTTLGRVILILFILGISCVNQVLGIIAVLCIIIMYNQSGIGYLEGFEVDTSGKKNFVENSTDLNNKKEKYTKKYNFFKN